MNHTRRMTRWAAMAALPWALAACESENVIGPENSLVVSNIQDQFSYAILALDNVTDSDRHFWVNTGTTATVDITQAITDGNATLQIRDGNGEIVYSDAIADDNDTTTPVGVTGIWQIDVVMTKASGEFSFTVVRGP